MNLDLITAVLENPTEENVQALLDDDQTVFWVDWREEDDAIPGYCESILQTGHLSGEADTEAGYEVYVSYKERRLRVPIVIGHEDRHITICTLNEALAPDYEVRFCIDSDGGDTLAFLPLPSSTWAELEEGYGARVHERFYRITPKPNLFTDPLEF